MRDGRDERRAGTAAPISRQRELFLNIAELRFRQTDRLVNKVVTDLREIEGRIAAGAPVAFPVTVSDTYNVVRPNAEGVGNGTQTISVRIETAASIWEQVLRADMAAGMAPSRSLAWNWVSAARKQKVLPRADDEDPYVDGTSWSKPAAGRRSASGRFRAMCSQKFLLKDENCIRVASVLGVTPI
jgi:hypothetical protein